MWESAAGGPRKRTWLLVDLAVAIALLVASLVESTGEHPHENGWAGPGPTPYLLAFAAAAGLLLRRAAPVAAAALELAVAASAVALVAPDQGPLELFIPVVLVSYSVGALATLLPSLLVLGAALALSVAAVAAGVNGGASNTVPAAIWLVLGWTMGRIVRSRTERTRQLEDVTAQLVVEREERAQAAVILERARMARELHDVVAHNVSVMVLHAQAGDRGLAGEQPEAHEAFALIETVGRQTVDELRRLLGILREDEALALVPPPSLAYVESLVEGVRAAGLDVHLTVEGEVRPLLTGVDVAAYRILQEALTNALKHSGSTLAQVVVRCGDKTVEVEVIDNGGEAAGVPPVEGAGHGLVGMRERVALYGGLLEAGPRVGGGFAVRAVLPWAGVPA